MNAELKKWLPWIAVGAVAVILAVVLVSNLGGGDTVAANSTTTGPESTTSVPPTTSTTAKGTTTTVEETTTSSAPVESTTTSSVETTTTSAGESTVELSDEGVQAGSQWVHFGFDDEDAIEAVAAVLGAPTNDSGWVDSFSVYGTCPAPVVRGVHWDDFVMLFTQADTDFWSAGVPHFFGYYLTSPSPELVTTENIGVGSSVDLLVAAYGGALYTMEESFFDSALGYWTYDQQTWTGLWGYSTGMASSDVVTSVNGGSGCGE